MFGDFMGNFGLNAFPWDSLDPQGGMFGPNAPQAPLIGSQNAGTAPAPGGGGPGNNMASPAEGGAAPQGSPPASPAAPPMSPTGSSPLANPGSFGQGGTPAPAPTQPTAPAAGVGSAFGSALQ